MYHQINTSFIYVYNHNCTYFQSFVEHGANKVVAGKCVTGINTPPHIYFNI